MPISGSSTQTTGAHIPVLSYPNATAKVGGVVLSFESYSDLLTAVGVEKQNTVDGNGSGFPANNWSQGQRLTADDLFAVTFHWNKAGGHARKVSIGSQFTYTMAADSNRVIIGTGAATGGNNGDLFYLSDAMTVWLKTSGTWGFLSNAASLSAAQFAYLSANLLSAPSTRIMAVIGHSFAGRSLGLDRIISVGATDAVPVYGSNMPLLFALQKLGWPVTIPFPYVFAKSGAKIVNAAPDATYPAITIYDGTVINDLRGCVTALLDFPKTKNLPLPAWVYFVAGVNDEGDFRSDTTGGLFIRISTEVDRLLAAGINVALELITPAGNQAGGSGGFGLAGTTISSTNARLRTYYGKNSRVLLFDPYWLVLDQAKMLSTDQPCMNPNFTPDGTHLNGTIASLLGRSSLAPLLATQYPFNSPLEWLAQHTGDVFDATLNPYGNRFLNPYFVGSGGTPYPNSGTITGNVPTSWQMQHNGAGTGTCVLSTEATPILLPDGTASGQSFTRLVLTLTQAGGTADEWWFSQLTTNRGPAAPFAEFGRYFAADIEIMSGSVGLLEVGLKCIGVNDGAPDYNGVQAGNGGYVSDARATTGVREVLRTPDQRLKYTGIFRLNEAVRIRVAVGGSAVIKIGRPAARSSSPGTILRDGTIVS